MCGFAGIYQPTGAKAENLRKLAVDMSSVLSHRGPDDDGDWG